MTEKKCSVSTKPEIRRQRWSGQGFNEPARKPEQVALTGGTSGTVPSHPTPGLALPGCGSCGVGGQWSQPWPAGLTQFGGMVDQGQAAKEKSQAAERKGGGGGDE